MNEDTELQAKFIDTEKALLDSILEDYTPAITHINNFLNIPRGGPMTFLENNLLRFPQAKGASSGYGTAMHAVLNDSLLYLKKNDKYPNLSEVKDWFIKRLQYERLNKEDYKNYSEKGLNALDLIYKDKILTLQKQDKSEIDFKHEGVVLENKDILHFQDENNVYVADYKTGKNIKDFDKGAEYEKIKSHFYKNQLIYYKLLIKKSKSFNHLNVLGGMLEFLEGDNELYNLYLDIQDEDIERLERLIIAVYRRIKNHDFTIPDSLKDIGELESIEGFEEILLKEV